MKNVLVTPIIYYHSKLRFSCLWDTTHFCLAYNLEQGIQFPNKPTNSWWMNKHCVIKPSLQMATILWLLVCFPLKNGGKKIKWQCCVPWKCIFLPWIFILKAKLTFVCQQLEYEYLLEILPPQRSSFDKLTNSDFLRLKVYLFSVSLQIKSRADFCMSTVNMRIPT